MVINMYTHGYNHAWLCIHRLIFDIMIDMPTTLSMNSLTLTYLSIYLRI